MGSAFKPNKHGLDQMQRELQRELDKRPVYVRAEAAPAAVLPPATTINNYHGPVVIVNGAHARIAWNNDTANQAQSRTEQIAPGYEALAELVTDLLANLEIFSLSDDEVDDVRAAARDVLGEVVRGEPDQSVIRRAVTMLKGVLAPIMAGVSQAVTAESADAARHVVEALSSSLPL